LISFLSAGEATRSSAAAVDYATFAYELIAFVTKEILPDSHDEYPESPLGSHLTRNTADPASPFGKHCLIVVSQVGALVPSLSGASSFAIGSTSGFDDLLRLGSTALALHQIWSALKNDVEGDRRGFSLNPKVGAHRIGVNLTFHW